MSKFNEIPRPVAKLCKDQEFGVVVKKEHSCADKSSSGPTSEARVFAKLPAGVRCMW